MIKDYYNGYFTSWLSDGPPEYNGLNENQSTGPEIIYNLLRSKRTEFAAMGIFVLIIVNFILLWLFALSTIIANFIIALRQENNNGHHGGSYTVGAHGNLFN